jgi:NRPS condensation-like uncharacterized protein
MTAYCNGTFKRKMSGAERVLLMLPLNVVMVARIQGTVDVQKLAAALDRLRQRHALLAVRVVRDEHDTAWYVTGDVPAFPIHTEARTTDDPWQQRAIAEMQTPFPIETGPLVRFALLQAPEQSDLIICAHHAICDGISLTYLIRDILQQMADSACAVERLPEPPAITRATVPAPPPSPLIARAFIGLYNVLWNRKKVTFDTHDLERLHRVFWEQNEGARLLAWTCPEAETQALVARCRAERVTVNTAIWTAFLAAQHDVQGDTAPYRARAGLPVSTRDKLNVPVGEAFGFYAASLSATLHAAPTGPQPDFWDAARIVHEQIQTSLEKTNLFRSLSADGLAPSLLDSLYFSKYGLRKSRLSDTLVQQMNWQDTHYGYSITNVGRRNIPTSYGPYQLDAVYGPIIYSDVNEKTLGVITVGNAMTFLMSYNAAHVAPHTAEAIRDAAMGYLSRAVASEQEGKGH